MAMRRTTSFVAILVVSAVFGLVVFGPSLMAHGMSHSGQCPVVALSGSSCLSIGSFLGHLSVITDAFTGIVQHAGMMSLLFAMIIVAAAISIPTAPLVVMSVSFSRTRQEQHSAILLSLQKYFRWNSLLEHSPTVG